MKKIAFVLLSILLITATVFSVSADSPAFGEVHPVALSYFKGVVDKFAPSTNYVIFLDDEYTASIVYSSNLSYEDSVFKCSSNCDSYSYNLHGIDNGDGTFTPSVSFIPLNDFELSVDDGYIIYSSLGDYSDVGDSNRNIVKYILYTAIFLLLIFIVFKFFRNRRHYIDI